MNLSRVSVEKFVLFCHANASEVTVPHCLELGQHFDDFCAVRGVLFVNQTSFCQPCASCLEPST